MNKVTFLFGAGASRNALPIVKEIPGRINRLIEILSSDEFLLDSNSFFKEINTEKAKREIQLEMIEYLKWLVEASVESDSVDTLAKKLFLKKEFDTLKKLKLALSVFFVCEQVRNKPDRRYDSFFASILNSINELPENIKIVTWNYDYQFEITFSEFIDHKDLMNIESRLSIYSKNQQLAYSSDIRIYKLNGTVGLYRSFYNNYKFINDIKRPFDREFVHELTKNFAAAIYLDDLKPSLSFAWENEGLQSNVVDSAAQGVKDSIALVVIGYSFPFFNRDIDRKIISSMTKLKRVYFQAPDADNLKERFQALRDDLTGIELISKFDTEQFLLPNEL
ncbi:hypothetical protein [Ignavibacterium album]|uniref:hypothetical protein n=1 Tax=Ignavibacterium album TaxID=591197 RepID=UPI0035BA417C